MDNRTIEDAANGARHALYNATRESIHSWKRWHHRLFRWKYLKRLSELEGARNATVGLAQKQLVAETEQCPCSAEQFLVAENAALRQAGCKLAEAALHVAREYDGVHRLMLAVAEWAKALADEGGRGERNK